MRARSTSAVLSSIILGGWLTGAVAQSTGFDTPNALNSTPDDQTAGLDDLPVGVIPQPTYETPGMVVGFTLGELYTDNLRLASSGEPKESSWITQLQPFLKLARSGPRFSGLLDYRMTASLYPGHSRYNQVAHDLKARGSYTILPQHLFVDGIAMYSRELINNERSSGSGTFFLSNNNANIARAAISPHWVDDLGRLGTVSVRYTLGRVMYNDHGISGQSAGRLNGIPDITSKTVQFSLESPRDQTWGWNLGYSDQRIEPDFGQGIEYALAKLGTSWQVSNSTQLLADVGKETRFLPDGTTRKLGANFWDAGFKWSNTRDYLRVLVGHRFYGKSYEFSWSHTAALLTTNVSYKERPTDINQQLLGQNFGQGISLPGGASSLPSLLDRRVYLMKRAAASATYTMPKSHLGLALYDERRTFLTLGDRQERVTGANLNWQFELGPFTTLTPTVGRQRYEFQDGQISHSNYAQLALVHQINPNNFATLRLRTASRNVDFAVPAAHDYRVNVVFAQWTHLF
ncbi:MAG: TIGR03016 family PEP-CTERM system-associated outer membrane protein [Rhodanobacter sp.]